MAGIVIPRWLPNAISVVRVLLVPVWGGAAELCRAAVLAGDAVGEERYRALCVAVLATIGASDVVDGFLARRFGLATRMGATLDAFADKLAQVGLLLFFTLRGAPAFPAAPLWFLVLVLGRDVLLGAGWLYLRSRLGSVAVVHRAHGKLSSVLLFALLVLLSLGVGVALQPLVWTITAVIVGSTVSYVLDGRGQLRTRCGAGSSAGGRGE